MGSVRERDLNESLAALINILHVTRSDLQTARREKEQVGIFSAPEALVTILVLQTEQQLLAMQTQYTLEIADLMKTCERLREQVQEAKRKEPEEVCTRAGSLVVCLTCDTCSWCGCARRSKLNKSCCGTPCRSCSQSYERSRTNLRGFRWVLLLSRDALSVGTMARSVSEVGAERRAEEALHQTVEALEESLDAAKHALREKGLGVTFDSAGPFLTSYAGEELEAKQRECNTTRLDLVKANAEKTGLERQYDKNLVSTQLDMS